MRNALLRTTRVCSLLAGVALAAAACGPSKAAVADRKAGRALVQELRSELVRRDASFAKAAAEHLAQAAAGPCKAGEIEVSSETFAEVKVDNLDGIALPHTAKLNASLRQATDLLDDESETFRWTNGHALARDQAAELKAGAPLDLVMVASIENVELGPGDTFVGGRFVGRLLGWDSSRDAFVCSADFEYQPTVIGADDRGMEMSNVVYGARDAALKAAGFTDMVPSRLGAPGLAL